MIRICKICNEEFSDNNLLSNHLCSKHHISSRTYYDTYIKKEDEGICETCGNETKYISMTEGYRRFCCNSCAQLSKSVQEKYKETCRKKYGADHYSSTGMWLESIKKTNMEKYGVEFAPQSEELKKKQAQTFMKKYGTVQYSQTDECKEKVAQTNTEKYGKPYLMQVDDFKNKSKQTCIEKYGHENVSQVQEIQERKIKTNRERYGVDWFSNSEKTKQTCIEKYGVSSYMKTDEYAVKTRQTNLIKYGKPYFSQTDEFIRRTKETNLSKYGVEYASQNHDIRVKSQSRYMYNMKNVDSSWELAYYIWLKEHDVKFEYQPDMVFEYEYGGERHKYHPDFKVNGVIQEIKGLQFFEDQDSTKRMINPYDREQDGLFEAKHQCMLRNNVEIITDCKEYVDYVNEKYGPEYLQRFRITNILGIYETLGEFPYFSFRNLSLNAPYAIIQQYHRSIWDARVGNNMSPVEAWRDKDILLKVISNRLIYKEPPYTPNKILQGLNITKLAPKVSVFKPSIGIGLIKRHLSDMDEIFDPFSGFSGRMLAAAKCGKRYTGQDINELHVEESNAIVRDFGLSDCTVVKKDIFESVGEYDCLFTCPPYEDMERWNDDDKNMTCDQWIEECLNRFKCKKYLFVVDRTEKYKDDIVETIENRSHFGKNTEYVILISYK